MTIAVDLGRKATKQTNKQKHSFDLGALTWGRFYVGFLYLRKWLYFLIPFRLSCGILGIVRNNLLRDQAKKGDIHCKLISCHRKAKQVRL